MRIGVVNKPTRAQSFQARIIGETHSSRCPETSVQTGLREVGTPISSPQFKPTGWVILASMTLPSQGQKFNALSHKPLVSAASAIQNCIKDTAQYGPDGLT
jgi:hypothetical protein